MPLQPEDTLLNGKFRVIRQLGRGGFGFVYLAEDTLLREQVAIKELIPALVGDEVALKRFLAEAKATMRLRHERLVGTHDVFSERGNYYIAMEYMPGGSLEARLKERGALPVDDAVHVAADVAEGLAYAHEHGVVHCDLKPANILFTADGHAKIADFGIAHVSDQMLSRSWLTPAGFVAGTLPYMSPEQADGVRDEPRADLYALGAVMYRMLTDRTYLDFEEVDSPRAQARNVQRIEAEQPLPPSSHNRRVPAWLDRVVLKALAKQPGDRYASAGELLVALAARGAVPASPAVEPETVVVPPQPKPTPQAVAPISIPRPTSSPPVPLPKWLWPAIGGTVVLLVVVVIALIASTTGRGNGKSLGATNTSRVPATSRVVAQAVVTSSLTPRPPAITTLPPTATNQPIATPVLLTSIPSASLTQTSTAMPTYTPTSSVSPTPVPRPAFTVMESIANVRDGPDTVYQVVGTLRQGETFEITGQSQEGDWWRFTYNSKPAWVSNSVVDANSEAARAPVVAAPSATPTPKPSATSIPTVAVPRASSVTPKPDNLQLPSPIPRYATNRLADKPVCFHWDWSGTLELNQGFALFAWKTDPIPGGYPPVPIGLKDWALPSAHDACFGERIMSSPFCVWISRESGLYAWTVVVVDRAQHIGKACAILTEKPVTGYVSLD